MSSQSRVMAFFVYIYKFQFTCRHVQLKFVIIPATIFGYQKSATNKLEIGRHT